MSNVIQLPPKIKDFGDLFHAIMDECIELEKHKKDHIDATADICNIVNQYLEFAIGVGCKAMTDEYDKLANILIENNILIPD